MAMVTLAGVWVDLVHVTGHSISIPVGFCLGVFLRSRH